MQFGQLKRHEFITLFGAAAAWSRAAMAFFEQLTSGAEASVHPAWVKNQGGKSNKGNPQS